MTTVFNINDASEQTFSCPPDQAVIAAHAQSRKDWSTWDYFAKYKATEGKYGWACGDFWAKK